MAILWADSFDHYGTTPNGGRTMMTSGAWAEVSEDAGAWAPRVSTTQKRTGDHSLSFPDNNFSTNRPIARRVFGATKLVVGVAFGLYLVNIPDTDDSIGVQFRNPSNVPILSVGFQSDGALSVRSGDYEDALLALSDPALRAASWDHVEIKTVFDDTVGSVEIRVNGITVLNADNLALSAVGAATVVFGRLDAVSRLGSDNAHFIDDVIAWDDTGTINNDFLGGQRVLTIFPNSDEAGNDWAIVGAATGHEAIDEVPPDSDTTYVGSDTAGEISQFGLPTLPPEVADITGVYVPLFGKLSAAGTGHVQVSMISGADVSAGPDTPLTSGYSYYGSVHETDPDTGLPWTKSGLEAALIQIEKTV